MVHKLALIGHNLSHSLSPVIHKAGLESLGLGGTYEILDTPPEDLISRIKFLKSNPYTGFNVTIPLKVPMGLFLDHVDKHADIAGCVNTVKILDDRTFYGYNTDIYGFKAAIPVKIQQRLKGANVSILGTGGASRAAAVGLIELGAKEIDFYSRNIINSSPLINYLRKTFPNVTFRLSQIQQTRDLAKTTMLVNTTPIGMRGNSMDQMPIDYEALKNLNKQAVVYDVIYNPTKTLLIEKAQECGLETINGLDMFINQAAKALEIWTGKIPDADKMKIAALESLACTN
jgi:shikimate dehydrogenase